jgi:hypothetical protein
MKQHNHYFLNKSLKKLLYQFVRIYEQVPICAPVHGLPSLARPSQVDALCEWVRPGTDHAKVCLVDPDARACASVQMSVEMSIVQCMLPSHQQVHVSYPCLGGLQVATVDFFGLHSG